MVAAESRAGDGARLHEFYPESKKDTLTVKDYLTRWHARRQSVYLEA